MMTERMTLASERYFRALGSLDEGNYLACFSSDAVLRDPYGSKEFAGHDGLAKWFAGMVRTWTHFSMRPVSHYVSGDRAAICWTADAVAKSGKSATFDGISVITVEESGLISELDGYWDATAMLAQIS